MLLHCGIAGFSWATVIRDCPKKGRFLSQSPTKFLWGIGNKGLDHAIKSLKHETADLRASMVAILRALVFAFSSRIGFVRETGQGISIKKQKPF